MKKLFYTVTLGATVLLGAGQAAAVSTETTILLQLLQEKGVISQADAEQFKTTIDQKMAEDTNQSPDYHHMTHGIAKQIEAQEKITNPDIDNQEGLAEKVQVSGVIEVDATMGHTKFGNGTTENSSDIALATAQLNVDTKINKHVNGHITLLYEEDNSNNDGSGIVIDEGIISLEGGNDLPLYLNAGKLILPFGYFNSHLITDPLTLTLGRTKDTALIVGYNNSIVDINAGVFKGAVKEAGNDNKIDSFVSSATFTMPENTVTGLSMLAGISYTSNMAASDTLQDQTTSGEISDMTGGYSAFLHLEYLEKYIFDAEYLGAIDNFAVGDMGFIDTDNNKPASWNIELTAPVIPKLGAALRYGGSSEAGTYNDITMPQSQIGGALFYDVFADTAITLEYLHNEYKNKTNDDLANLQLAVEF